MKRAISLLLSLSLLLPLLSACQQPAAQSDPPVPSAGQPVGPSAQLPEPSAPPPETSAQPPEPSDEPAPSAPAEADLLCNLILNELWPELGFDGNHMDYYSAGVREPLAAYLEGAYGLAEGQWEDAGVCRKTGASAAELAVLRFADESAADHGEDCLRAYLHSREGDFTGYAPEQARLVADAVICRQGLYMGLFICEDTGKAQSLFASVVENVLSGGVLGQESEFVWNVNSILDRLVDFCREAGDDMSDVKRIGSGDPDQLKYIVEEEYGLAAGSWEEAAVVWGTNGSVFELAVLRTGSGEASRRIAQDLNGYLNDREEAFARFPAQAELLHNAMACHMEEYCVLLVCKDWEGAMWDLLALSVSSPGPSSYGYFQRHQETGSDPSLSPSDAEKDPDWPDRIKFVAPGKEDMSIYDTAAIRAAWAQGDPSGLSDADRAIYDGARQVLEELLTDGMSDFEKEHAVYTWLVDHVTYDWTHQDVMAETPRESYGPYGGLVNRTAVCLGYATSFQLLMDLSGVECITVVGACFESEEHHAWNMVRLNGEWYCVDVTWDANGRELLGAVYEWKHFNVTSDEMGRNHQWDYANTPEATAEDHGQPS